MRDIVYIIKDDLPTTELKYSLRSVEANFPHRLVWFVGGKPDKLKPDRMLRHSQTGPTKWDRIKSSMLEVVKQDELSDEFFLFNDDFFVMKPFEGEFVNYIDRSLEDRIQDFYKERGSLNRYAFSLWHTENELKLRGQSTHNFEVHIPMLLNKSKALEILSEYESPQLRSLYGNVSGCEIIDRPDVKVNRIDIVPKDADFISTNDNTFCMGRIGEYIRETFNTPSPFEM